MSTLTKNQQAALQGAPERFDLPSGKYHLERLLSSEAVWRVAANGVWIGDLSRDQFATSIEYGKLILAFWSESFSQSWRVAAFDERPEGLRLDLSRKMGGERLSLELRRSKGENAPDLSAEARRKRYLDQMVMALLASVPAVKIERADTGYTAVPGLSSIYGRVQFRSGKHRAVAIGVGPGESEDSIIGILAAAIVWVRELAASGALPERCLIIVPQRRVGAMARRLTALRTEVSARLELFEMIEHEGALRSSHGAHQDLLFDPVSTKLPRTRGAQQIAPTEHEMLGALPDGVRAFPHPMTGTLHIRCRGLELGRLGPRGFRINRAIAEAAGLARKRPSIQELARAVAGIRHARAEDHWHPLYRWQSERWLEELIREDLTALDPELDPQVVYPQVPAHDETGRRMVDLLGIRRDGRLAILELKVSEDAQLPLQGIDYWLRVEWHRRRGDFERRGYFPGRAIAPLPSLLILVAPIFRFHRAFDIIAGALSPRIPIQRISINEDWRMGIKVLRRERLNARGKTYD